MLQTKNHGARQRLVAIHLVPKPAGIFLCFDGTLVGGKPPELKTAGAIIALDQVWAQPKAKFRERPGSALKVGFVNTFRGALRMIPNHSLTTGVAE